ncbi:MAG: GAF domain-containing protein [Deltaproteobacteria bacterium]|nr:GAF domain-containing protein [Deltaproteobacteria bacterium]
MKFQVFVPPLSEDEFAMTFQVEAKDWMAALRQIVMRISPDGKMISNLMCDVKEDNTFHVTDPKSGRVFQVKSADAGPTGETKAAEPAPAPAAEPAPVVEKKPEPPVAKVVEKPEPAPVAVVSHAAETEEEQEAKPKKEKLKKKQHREDDVRESDEDRAPAVAPVAAVREVASVAEAKPGAAARGFDELEKTGPQQIGRAVTEAEWNAEELLAQVFEEVQDLYTVGGGTTAAARFALDLALKHVRCESGAVLLSDFSAKELAFAAASGPKAREVLSFRVPMGQGIAGFCAQEGVTIAVSAVEKDPRFFRKIAEALGYETKSILCAPIVSNGKTVGVLEVLNRYLSSSFAPAEVNVLSYIATRLGEHLGEAA